MMSKKSLEEIRTQIIKECERAVKHQGSLKRLSPHRSPAQTVTAVA
jgi:hypothetical protein